MTCLRLTLFLLLVSSTAFAKTELKFDEKDALFTIQENTLDLVTTDFLFWEGNWKWAGTKIQTSALGQGVYTFAGEVRNLDLKIEGRAETTLENQFAYTLEIDATSSRDGVIGGGIVFRLNLEAIRISGQSPVPELLPNNSGWRVQMNDKREFLTVSFDPPVARVYFERGNKDEIRAFFYYGSITPGRKTVQMTVTLPQDGRVVPTINERLGGGPKATWYRDVLYWATSPVDLSFLNEPERPAGKHGFVRADGEDLIFEDGVQARFWGINLMASALFRTNSVDVRRQAKRLSKLGFNLVRITHHDSSWVRLNVFGENASDTLSLSQTALKKLDWWIKSLKDEGIYVWLDLNVGRTFTAEDNIRDFSEIAKGKPGTKARGFIYINTTLEERLKEFQGAYLNHVNAYTSLAYKDDPVIVAVLITNENDLTHHFGNALLPDKNVPLHNALYMAEAAAFAAKNRLPLRQTWQSWEHGPSKIFLNDLEHRFNEKMIGHLRGLGFQALISTTQTWGKMSLSGLASLTDGDIISVNSYGKSNEIENNPKYASTWLHWIAAAQVSGKPLAVTEWNLSPFPAFDRFHLPLQVAAIARLQGWDAIMQYGYAQIPLNSAGRPGNWLAFNDPAALAMMPAAALIYRQSHVREAENTYALKLGPREFYYKEVSAKTSSAIRTTAEQSRIVIELPETPELPWLRPEKTDKEKIVATDPKQDFLPVGQNFVLSDTGEIYRNWEDGIFTINTKRSQVAAGWLGGKLIELDDIALALATKNAAVAVQSLTEQPIRTSRKILISLSARSEPAERGKLPFLSEPVVGELRIRAPKGLNLVTLDRVGKRNPLPTIYSDGEYIIDLSHEFQTYWLALEPASSLETFNSSQK